MKRWPLFCLTLLMLALGCNRKPTFETLSGTNPTFAEIYLVKDRYPDSALKLMQSVTSRFNEEETRQQSEFLFAEYQLLKAEVNYKNYLPVANETQVMDAYRFYDSIRSANHAMRKNKFLAFQFARASYFKAVVEESHPDAQVQSFSDYLQSLWFTEGLNRERWVLQFSVHNPEYEHFTGLIYDRLAWFFYNHDAWGSAIECLERSNACFAEEGLLEGIASNYDLMGDVMLAQEDRVGAVGCYKEADSIYRLIKKDNDFLKFNGMLHHGITLSSMGDKEGARILLLQALENSNRPWMTRRLHFGLGYIYYDLQQPDSSLYHYENSFPLLPRQTAKAYCRIIELASLLGETEKVAHYGELLAQYYMNQVQMNVEKTRMLSLYENFKANTKDVRNKDVFFFIILIVIVLTLVVVIDSVFIHSRKRRHRREMARQERINASLEDEIEAVRRASRRKEERIRDLESKLNKIVTNPEFQHLPFEKKMETLMAMPVCKRVLMVKDANVKAGAAYPELVLSENQRSSLINAVDSVFSRFSVKIIEKYPRLKRSDVVYCCMYVLGVSEVQAAALTGKTYQAVWARSLKMHEIFGNKSNLQLFLIDFIKDCSSAIYD